MDTTAWVDLARSQDTTRANLCVSWVRDHVRFATNGHRLHLAPAPEAPDGWAGPPNVQNPGRVAPPWQVVVPDGQGILIPVAGMRQLRKALREADRIGPRRQTRAVILSFKPEIQALAVTGLEAAHGCQTEGEYLLSPGRVATVEKAEPWLISTDPITKFSGGKGTPRVWINVGYLLEACAGEGDARILIDDSSRPIKIAHADGRIAVVMPMAGR